jgi:hypothetical protein
MNPLSTHCPGHLLTGVISLPVSNEDPIQRLQASEYCRRVLESPLLSVVSNGPVRVPNLDHSSRLSASRRGATWLCHMLHRTMLAVVS